MTTSAEITHSAVQLGKISTPKKARAARKNGRLGGRPKGSKNKRSNSVDK